MEDDEIDTPTPTPATNNATNESDVPDESWFSITEDSMKEIHDSMVHFLEHELRSVS